MKEKNISTYTLQKRGICSKTIYNLKHNKSITMYTLAKIAEILECSANEIVQFDHEEL